MKRKVIDSKQIRGKRIDRIFLESNKDVRIEVSTMICDVVMSGIVIGKHWYESLFNTYREFENDQWIRYQPTSISIDSDLLPLLNEVEDCYLSYSKTDKKVYLRVFLNNKASLSLPEWKQWWVSGRHIVNEAQS